jgi:DNA repair exonuclease SbcCD nuclease subunit
MVRFLHTADWQLGMTRHYLSEEAQALFSDARLNVIEEMGNLAINEGCQFVVVCGDVFESNQVVRRVITRAFEKMAAVPGVTFYLLPGNHDPLDASSIYRSSTFTQNQPDNVKVLDASEPVQAVPGVELIPAPWPNKHPTSDLVADAYQGLGPTYAVRIVVGHGTIDAMSPSPNDPKLIGLERLEEKIRAGLIHYVALGDRHSATDVGATGKVWYAGAPEPTDYNETDPGKVLFVDVDAKNVRVEDRQLATWRFVSHDWQLSSDADIDALEEWFSALSNKDRAIVKVALVGQVSLAQKARLDSILEHNTDLLAALETWERRSDLAIIPDEVDLERLGLSGFAHEAIVELSKIAESGEEAPIARDALALLYRLAGPRA